MNGIGRDTVPPEVAERTVSSRECLSWLLCAYSNHRGQQAVFHFPELLLFVFLCGGITVWKKKGGVITPSWVFPTILLPYESTSESFWFETLKIYFDLLWLLNFPPATLKLVLRNSVASSGRSSNCRPDVLKFQAGCKKLKNATWEFDHNHFLSESFNQNMQMMISGAITLLLLQYWKVQSPPPPSTVRYIQHLDLICLFFRLQSVSRTVRSVHTTPSLHWPNADLLPWGGKKKSKKQKQRNQLTHDRMNNMYNMLAISCGSNDISLITVDLRVREI